MNQEKHAILGGICGLAFGLIFGWVYGGSLFASVAYGILGGVIGSITGGGPLSPDIDWYLPFIPHRNFITHGFMAVLFLELAWTRSLNEPIITLFPNIQGLISLLPFVAVSWSSHIIADVFSKKNKFVREIKPKNWYRGKYGFGLCIVAVLITLSKLFSFIFVKIRF